MVVSHKELCRALSASIGKKGMSREEVAHLSEYVLSFFGFDTEVVDNRLTSEDRDVFYLLEEAGLVGTRMEEVLIRRGKMWRMHFWVLKTEVVKKLALQAEAVGSTEELSVYGSVSDEMWARRA